VSNSTIREHYKQETSGYGLGHLETPGWRRYGMQFKKYGLSWEWCV